MDRRTFLGAVIGIAPVALGGCSAEAQQPGSRRTAKAAATFEVTRSDADWRKVLTPAQFAVLRGHGTERPGTSPLNAEHRQGTYQCAGCNLPVYSSRAKFESGTGWPSFTAPLENAIGTSEDRSLFGLRIEVHCRRCGGHLGHVFDDGPRPTGKRYCMNGDALVFTPTSQGASR
ncbi:MAG: peptide-methionine (R)-S-oxide reductase MsrB [Acidobacteria bacterium]|nr:peptide-methionine (R)-S-oxide reductase MsrB [Acidobacteriota bacterium]